MDLYSASRRHARPFRFETPEDLARLPLSARALIGDCHTAALVRADGAIDWLCFPRFDSPSVFGGLLDERRGGSSGIRPARLPFSSLQAYDPDTNVLETLFDVAGEGVVRLTDHMPWDDEPRATIHEVHRRVECREGSVELELTFDPRFDYGAVVPTLERHPNGLLAVGPDTRLAAVVDREMDWRPRPEGGLGARVRLRSGEQFWMILSWNAPTPEPIAAYRPFEQLRATRHRWREWSRQLSYDGPFRHHVMRSALALKLMTYAPTGAMVAAPTTSLPEWLGGTRNWDYRFTWTRDTAMAIRASNRIGYRREARDFFHFIRDALEAQPQLQVMYTVLGEPVPPERELEHLSGFANSRPVRVGNGARDQLQLDTAGALLDAAHLYEQMGGAIMLRAYRQLRQVVQTVARSWTEPDHGIWEPRNGVRHNVHSKLMSWVALDNGSRLAQHFGDSGRVLEWSQDAARVRQDILTHGLSADGSHFVSQYGGKDLDAALLLLPIHNFTEPTDARTLATVNAVRERLENNGFLYRYKVEDGVGGEEGAFTLCGFWLAEALARAGQIDEAQEVFSRHAEASNHVGLLAEEIDPRDGSLLGNFPQAFSHLGLVNAALRIDKGLRARDESNGHAEGSG